MRTRNAGRERLHNGTEAKDMSADDIVYLVARAVLGSPTHRRLSRSVRITGTQNAGGRDARYRGCLAVTHALEPFVHRGP